MKVHAILAAFPRACPNAIKIACTTLLCALLVSGAAPQNELRFCIEGDPKTFDPQQVSEENSEVIR